MRSSNSSSTSPQLWIETRPAGVVHGMVHAFQLRTDACAPVFEPHEQAVLASPVIAKMYGVEVILGGLFHECDVVIRDGASSSDKARISTKSMKRFSMPRNVQARSKSEKPMPNCRKSSRCGSTPRRGL